MQAATDRLSIRARNVANVQTPGYKASDVVQEATGSGPVVSERLPVDQVNGETSGRTRCLISLPDHLRIKLPEVAPEAVPEGVWDQALQA